MFFCDRSPPIPSPTLICPEDVIQKTAAPWPKPCFECGENLTWAVRFGCV